MAFILFFEVGFSCLLTAVIGSYQGFRHNPGIGFKKIEKTQKNSQGLKGGRKARFGEVLGGLSQGVTSLAQSSWSLASSRTSPGRSAA